MKDLALGDEVLHRARDLLDGHSGINPMLVEQIDAVGSEALQHPVDGSSDVVGAAVHAAAALAGAWVDVPAELRGDDHLVA